MTEERSGLRSEDLRSALTEALGGRTTRLGELLSRHGGLPGPKPNLLLAVAFGEAIASKPGKGPQKLLEEMRIDTASAESAQAFLPIAAAYGYAARIETDPRDAWAGLFDLMADDRAPVRMGLTTALVTWAVRTPGSLDLLIQHANEWLHYEDRAHRFAACAIVLDVIAERRGPDGARDIPALLEWVTAVIADIADAPRAAERSPARRKVLASLPGALAEIANTLRGAEDGIGWLVARLAEARHPDLRIAMEHTIDLLRRGTHAQGAANILAMREALASSAKPPRDPARIREGMSSRGKKGGKRSR